MSLAEAFNNGGYKARKENDAVLAVEYASLAHYYDFAARMIITIYSGYEKGGVSTMPFAQADREVLIAMRDKLVELNGSPPELPPEAPAAPAPGGKFNL